MSLVERALDKLRNGGGESRRSKALATATPQRAIGALLDSQVIDAGGPRLAIDRRALRAAGYMPEEKLDRRFADEYRQIKRPLLAKAFASEPVARQSNPRLLMMASALPGDGKTFTSINLALSLARERDSSVVLVDADVAKPHISSIFGVADQRGLLDALTEADLDVNTLVLPTDVPGLSLLPAGHVREGAFELLSSGRMAELAAQILARHPRCVALFDSSPLVVSSESRALAAAMGQIVVVIRAGRTPRHAVLEALEELGPDKSVSLVLNQGRRSLIDGYYGYTYGTYGDEEQA